MQFAISFAFILSTLCMMGLIWFVQIVHYPLFKYVSKTNFVEYEKKHMTLTTYVVMPLMLLELGSSFALLLVKPSSFSTFFVYTNLFLLSIIWLSTFFIQVPLHNKLSENFNEKNIEKLVNSNWIRTILWSLRGLLLVTELVSGTT